MPLWLPLLLPFSLKLPPVLLRPYVQLRSVGVVVAEPVVQQLTQRSLLSKELGAVCRVTRAPTTRS